LYATQRALTKRYMTDVLRGEAETRSLLENERRQQ